MGCKHLYQAFRMIETAIPPRSSSSSSAYQEVKIWARDLQEARKVVAAINKRAASKMETDEWNWTFDLKSEEPCGAELGAELERLHAAWKKWEKGTVSKNLLPWAARASAVLMPSPERRVTRYKKVSGREDSAPLHFMEWD